MTVQPDVTRVVREWLEDGPTAMPDRVLDAVLDDLPSIQQRRLPRPAWRFSAMPNAFRLLGIAAAVLLLALAATLIPGGGGGPTLPPSPSPTSSPTPEPTPTLAPEPTGAVIPEGLLEPGTYEAVPLTGVGVRFTVPAGWSGFGNFAVLRLSSFVAFWTIDTVYADPCTHTPVEGPVGPTVDDLASAFAQIDGVVASDPVSISIGGRDGLRLQLTVPETLPCPSGTYDLWPERYVQGPGEVDTISILDVDGTRLVIAAGSLPQADQALHDEVDAIVASIEFLP